MIFQCISIDFCEIKLKNREKVNIAPSKRKKNEHKSIDQRKSTELPSFSSCKNFRCCFSLCISIRKNLHLHRQNTDPGQSQLQYSYNDLEGKEI